MIAYRTQAEPAAGPTTARHGNPATRYMRTVELADAMIDLAHVHGAATVEMLIGRGFSRAEIADLGEAARHEAARRERGEAAPAGAAEPDGGAA